MKDCYNRTIVITGPSAVGKTTIAKFLLKKLGRRLGRVITTTTRERRPNERNGRDYHFIDKAKFASIRKNRGFIESVLFDDHGYGTEKAELERICAKGKRPLIVVEVNGAKFWQKQGATIIFIAPKSVAQLKEQIAGRHLPKIEVENRLATAKAELLSEKNFHHLIINGPGELEQSEQKALGIISRL